LAVEVHGLGLVFSGYSGSSLSSFRNTLKLQIFLQILKRKEILTIKNHRHSDKGFLVSNCKSMKAFSNLRVNQSNMDNPFKT